MRGPVARRPLGLAVAAAIVACAPVREPVDLALTPAARAYVLGVVSDDALSVFAVGADGAGAAALPTFADYAGDPPIELIAYAYDVPLDELGIAAGPLPASLPSDAAAHGPPAPARLALRTVDERGPGEWVVSAGETDHRMQSFRSRALPAPDGCTDFSARAVELTTVTNPVVALVADGDDALVFTATPWFTAPADAELWRVRSADASASRVVDVPGLADLLAVGPVVTATRGRDGRLWISVGGQTPQGTAHHEVWVGDLVHGFAPIARQRTYDTDWMWWLVVEEGAQGDRLWALTDYNHVDRYDEATQTWLRLEGPRDPPTQTTCVAPRGHCGGLARGPDGALLVALPGYGDRVLRADGDRLVSEPLPEPRTNLTALSSTPLGPIAVRSTAVSTSFLLRGPGGRWAPIADTDGQTEQRIGRTFVVSGWRSGFAASGVFGFVLQHDGEVLCAAQSGVSAARTTAYLLELPSALIMSAGHNSEFAVIPPQVYVAKPSAP